VCLFHPRALPHLLLPLPERGPFARSARRKCLHLYFYFMDRDFGLIHVRIQTWFPMQIQVYLNAHKWLARKLSANQVRYTSTIASFSGSRTCQSTEVRRSHCERELARDPHQYAKRVNPQMRDILHDRPYYWVSAQKRILDRHSIQPWSGPLRLYPQPLSQCRSSSVPPSASRTRAARGGP
jgi:hypothetical protein